MRPPPKQREINCRQKRRYADEHTARAAAMLDMHGKRKLWVYECRECRGWHLTSRDQGTLKLVTPDNPVHF